MSEHTEHPTDEPKAPTATAEQAGEQPGAEVPGHPPAETASSTPPEPPALHAPAPDYRVSLRVTIAPPASP
jgi:hypothetical protein